MEAQGWGELSSTLSPTDIWRDCRRRLGPSQYNLFFEVLRVAGSSPPANLPLEVMGTPLIRLNPTPFPWSSRAFAAQPAIACVPACALAFARKLH